MYQAQLSLMTIQGRENEVVIVSLMRSNDKDTGIVKRTSRYERGEWTTRNNGRIVHEQIKCQNFYISHRGLDTRRESGCIHLRLRFTSFASTPSFRSSCCPGPDAMGRIEGFSVPPISCGYQLDMEGCREGSGSIKR